MSQVLQSAIIKTSKMILSVMGLGAAGIIFLYTTFPTKVDATAEHLRMQGNIDRNRDEISELKKMDGKLDLIIEYMKRKEK